MQDNEGIAPISAARAVSLGVSAIFICDAIFMWPIGALLLLARLLVSHGIQVIADGLQPTRVAGNMITWLTMLWVIGALIWGYFG